MIRPSAFSPPWWLANRHLQTILPNSPLRRTQALALRSECLELADGDFLRLEWLDRESGPVVAIFHGLEGSSRSPYIRGVMRALHARGFRVVLMSFRGCGGVPNRLARSYHAGETRDLAHVLDTLAARGPGSPIAALGYSLGGNALLKYLGERGADTPVATAVAVSVPFDLQEACAAMSLGMSRFYRRILLGRLKRSTRSKFETMPPPFDLATGLAACDFEGFDGHITAPLHGFADAPDYYRKASCRPWLARVAVPTLILQAEDDPFMTRAALPRAEDLSDRITLELSERGGHVGFVAGSAPWNLHCWLEGRIVQHCSALLAAGMPSWSPDSACSGECVPDDPPPAPSP
jgi:predicted alpha/beta-fold hydrolase